MRRRNDAEHCRRKWTALVGENEPEPGATRAAVAIEDEIKWLQTRPPADRPRSVLRLVPSVVRLAALNLERDAKVEEIALTLSAAMELVMAERAKDNIVDTVGDLEFVTSGEWAAYLPGMARRLKASLHRAWL